MLHWYNSAICIRGEYRDGASTISLSGTQARKFIDATKTCLNDLNATKTGAS